MRFIFKIVLFVAISLNAHAQIQADRTHESRSKQYDEFLKRLGFDDYSSVARKNLRERPDLSDEQKAVLKFKVGQFQVFNDVRFLTSHLMAHLEQLLDAGDSKSIREFEKTLIEFTYRMAFLQAAHPGTQLPAYIQSLPAEKRDEAIVSELEKRMREQMRDHARTGAADIVTLIYDDSKLGEVIRQIENPGTLVDDKLKSAELTQEMVKHMSRVIQFVYIYGETGHGRYFADALAAGIARVSKLRNLNLLANLEKRLLQSDNPDFRVPLENLIGLNGEAKVTLPGKKEYKSFDLQTGDIVTERAYGKGSVDLAIGARPALPYAQNTATGRYEFNLNWGRAVARRLLGFTPNTFLSIEDYNPSKASIWGKIRNRISEMEILNYGSSHVGAIKKWTDAETGISKAWVVDYYPDAEGGGVRIIPPDRFALPGYVTMFARSRWDSVKLYDFFQKFANNQGYRKSFEPTDRMNEETGKIEHGSWKPVISEEQFEELRRVPRSQAEEWASQAHEAAMNDMIYGMGLRDGVGFAYGFNNGPNVVYCKKAILMAYQRTRNFVIETFRDRYNWIVTVGKKIGLPGTENVRTDVGIDSPSTEWDPKIGLFERVIFTWRSFEERNSRLFQPMPTAMNERVLKALEQNSQLNSFVMRRTMELDGDAYVSATAVVNAKAPSKNDGFNRSSMGGGEGYGAALRSLRPEPTTNEMMCMKVLLIAK